MLKHWVDPPRSLADVSTEAMLRQLAGPSLLMFTGEDTRRTRVIVTLLHGNEPSGAHTLRRWIRSGLRPKTNLAVVMASVEAALTVPVFSHRMLPGRRDLNRCFRGPFDDREGRLARAILDELQRLNPEAVIDMHNTSGSGPAFGVCPHRDRQHEALVSLFAPRLVISALSLGALMELTDQDCPTVTVEVGGRQDDAANETAWAGWQRFALQEQVLATADAPPAALEIFENSVRLEVRSSTTLAYAPQPRTDVALTLRPDIEKLNFGAVPANTVLGWCGQPAQAVLSATNVAGEDVLDRLVTVRDGQLLTASALRLFMVTTHPHIALSDCLLYAASDTHRETLLGATSV